MANYTFLTPNGQRTLGAGFRSGPRGTHSSRTIMLAELSLLAANGLGGDIAKSILEDNVLGKSSAAGRNLSLQRLKELYSFDRSAPIFNLFARLYQRDPTALPQLALLMALARDPLLRASARAVLGLAPGSQLMRDLMKNAIVAAVGSRMNEAVVDKVFRNAASSWTKTGHLVGRTIKRRAHIRANLAAFAFSLWLAHKAGFSGLELFDNGWVAALDLDQNSARMLAERAHAAHLINFRTIGESFEFDFAPLERAN